MKDFYPRSPCGERPSGQIFGPAVCIIISIHALLAESDFSLPLTPTRVVLFLSTLSLRRATVTEVRMTEKPEGFYPRSPCGERRTINGNALHELDVSIHALLAESDHSQQILVQSVPHVSIHALLAESDM